MGEHKSYYAIIPANIRYDDSLIPSAKLLYGEITALCNEKGFCWASNDYFANQYKVSKPTIQNWLKSLEDKGYIYREVKYKQGSKEIEARYIRILGGGHQENLVGGHQEIYQDNNTLINNTFNKSSKHDSIPYSKIIDYLNHEAGKSFKVTQKWKDLIKARWNEGQRIEDFEKVIKVKSQQWRNNSEMNKFLRPMTLFGNKFDDYRNEYQESTNKPKDDYERQQEELRKAYEQ
jgi:uncharacterized phage protein (TIGR02220 family)